MLLVIDAGNTNVVIGLYAGETLRASWRLSTPRTWTADEVAILVGNLFQLRGLDLKEVAGVVIASVVPNLNTALREFSTQHLAITPVVIGPGIETGVRILYDNPREVGADRIANALAAFRKYGGPVIVIDLGTAVTYDAISGDGSYLGGAIAPGVGISLQALVDHTARLFRVEIEAPDSVIGRTTVTSIQSGLLWGFVAQIEGMVKRMTDELGGSARVIATGGQATMVSGLTTVIEAVDEDLTLEGLRLIHEMNSPAAPGTVVAKDGPG